MAVSAAALLVGVAGCGIDRSASGAAATSGIDLLATGDFANVAGVTPGEGVLAVRHLGRVVVEQDGSGGTPNPPWVLAGTHLTTTGGLTTEIGLSAIRGEAAVLMAGRPPVVYDEFVDNRGSLRVAVLGDEVSVELVTPSSGQQVVEQRNWTVTERSDHALRIAVDGPLDGGRLGVAVDGQTLGSLPAHGLFASGEVWFGLDAASEGGSFDVVDWRVAAGDDVRVRVVDTTPLRSGAPDDSGLHDLAVSRRPGFRIGAALSASSLFSDPEFAELALGGEIGQITTENALKAQFVQPQRGVFDFREADALVDTAIENSLDVHGHALIFGEANPRWLQDLAVDEPEQVREVLVEHVRTVVGRYAGRVRSWDVVNEPLADYGTEPGPSGLRQHLWLRALGPEYVALAFRTAHAADPEAKLFLNDFGLENGGERWETLRPFLEQLVADGVPIDGVGLQSHVYEPGDEIEPELLRGVLDDLAELGLEARISELDVYGADRDLQAAQYATVVRTCVEHPACESVTFWGISERYSSTSYLDNGRLVIGDGLPWDTDLRALPAVERMREELVDD